METSQPVIKQHPHRRHWDKRYSDGHIPRSPSALLRRWLPRLPRGTALDVACGTGRNALLLAHHGWRVVGVDISPVALHIARNAASERGLRPDLLAANLEDWPLPAAHFDLLCVFRFLDRALCPRFVAALKPGGVLICETFTIDQRRYEGGPRSDAMLLRPGELPGLFPDLDPLEHTEGIVIEDERPRALAGFVGVRTCERANVHT
jgi:tellurite methyltransferase